MTKPTTQDILSLPDLKPDGSNYAGTLNKGQITKTIILYCYVPTPAEGIFDVHAHEYKWDTKSAPPLILIQGHTLWRTEVIPADHNGGEMWIYKPADILSL